MPSARRTARYNATTASLSLSAVLGLVVISSWWAIRPGPHSVVEAGIALPDSGVPAVEYLQTTSTSLPTTDTAAPPSAGCANSGVPSASQQLSSGGLVRTFRVHAPESLERSAAVLINLHGRYANAEHQERYSGFIPVSDREGFLLVTPDGTGAIRGWSAGATVGSKVDDVTFLRDLIAHLARTYCIDTDRVFAAGMSNGAFMAALAGCKLPEIAGIAMVAGTSGPSTPCRGPVPVIAFHGTADSIVPFKAGMVRNTMSYPGAAPLMSKWAEQNRCTGTVHDDNGIPVAHLVYSGCDAATEFVVLHGAGHTWPGAAPSPDLGKTSTDVNAAEEIWRFFAGVSQR